VTKLETVVKEVKKNRTRTKIRGENPDLLKRWDEGGRPKDRGFWGLNHGGGKSWGLITLFQDYGQKLN